MSGLDTVYQHAIELLTPYFRSRKEREYWLNLAFFGRDEITAAIELEGTAAQFTLHCVQVLRKYGDVDGYPALSILLETVGSKQGASRQREFNGLAKELEESQPSSEPAIAHSLPEPVPVDNAAAKSNIDEKVHDKQFDVFLCHNTADKDQIRQIAKHLRSLGIRPWLDEEQLRPGLPWQPILEEQIDNIKSAAVFVGNSGFGPWQNMEVSAFLRQFVNRACPVIPVILPGCKNKPHLPAFLDNMGWVDFNQKIPEPYDQLIWGITGQRLHDP